MTKKVWPGSRRSLIVLVALIGCALALYFWFAMPDRFMPGRLQSPDPKTRHDALKELEYQVRKGNFRNVKSSLPHVCATLRESRSRSSRIDAVIAILQNIPPELGKDCVPDLIHCLKEAENHVSIRQACAAVLGRLGSTADKGAVDCLSTTLRDEPSVFVRREAALALGNLTGKENQAIVLALQQGISDVDPRTSLACAFSLWSKSETPAAVDRIIALLPDPDDRVRTDAAGALSQIIRGMPKKELDGPFATRIKDALQERIKNEDNGKVKFWVEEALRGFQKQ